MFSLICVIKIRKRKASNDGNPLGIDNRNKTNKEGGEWMRNEDVDWK